MPYQPSAGAGTSGVYISKALGNAAASFAQSLDNFAWAACFSRVPVLQEQGQYPTFPGGDWARVVAGPRGEGEESKGGNFTVTWASYETKLFAVHSDIGQKALNNAEPIMQLRMRKAKWCTQQIYTKLEQLWATAYFGASIWSTNRTGVTAVSDSTTEFLKWSDPGSSPIKDVMTIKAGVQLKSYGFEPNVGAIDYLTYMALLSHPEIVDRIKHTSDEVVTLGIMAKYFGLDKLVVCRAVYNSAQEGLTAVPAYVVGSGMLLVHVPQGGLSAETPAAGATLWWEGMEGSINGLQASEIDIPERRIRRVEVQAGVQMHLVSASLGGFLNATL